MNPKYEQEIKEFNNNFSSFKDKSIVLYGIGRLTATLLEGLKGFSIVGLMDKDPENVGKYYFGLPVLSSQQARDQADIIVINTVGAYWKIIYQRIKELGVPVYFRNGELAREEQVALKDNPYWNTSLESVMDKIANAEVVSFDFFDTLFSRRVCNPKDALILLEKKLKVHIPQIDVSWIALRNKAISHLGTNYCLDELYTEMMKIGDLSAEIIEKAKTIELRFEQHILVPRKSVLECVKKAIHLHKQVYVVTDMYLPVYFFVESLAEQGIYLESGHIIVSGVQKKNKLDGTVWQDFKKQIGNKKAIHIGDNQVADIDKPRQFGIDGYYIASAWDMLNMSPFRGITDKICTEYASMVMGSIQSNLCQDFFALNQTKGVFQIKNNYDMGYFIFGPVLLTFFRWVLEQAQKDNVQKLVFMSRDGYFLKQDFDEYLQLTGEFINTCYIGISRQLAMTAAVNDENDLWELVNMPYTGTLAEMLEDRFEIINTSVNSKEDIEKYLPDIWDKIHGIKERYQKYVAGYHFTCSDAVVDIGYYGNNQRYLNKISGAEMKGYYFNANISQENSNSSLQYMVPCFQKKDDYSGKESGILKYQMFLESFLTAPYGMVKDIDNNGNFLCKEKKHNQICFPAKEQINEGTKSFIRECINSFKGIDVKTDMDFVNEYYSMCFDGGFVFSDEVKRSFYNDNVMMNRIESHLFV